jgi:hypothetical protein
MEVMAMHWDSFTAILKDAEQKIDRIRLDFPGSVAFLKKSYLIVSCANEQIKAKKNLDVIDIADNLYLVEDSPLKTSLSDLSKKFRDMLAEVKKANKKEVRGEEKEIERLKADLRAFPIGDLEIRDDIDIQIIFPCVDMEKIQELKNHLLVNEAKTCRCRACIRVFLY